jgi:hypothetical protein
VQFEKESSSVILAQLGQMLPALEHLPKSELPFFLRRSTDFSITLPLTGRQGKFRFQPEFSEAM